MGSHFLHLTSTPAVLAEQDRYYARHHDAAADVEPDELTEVEREFIASRDSFYLATVTETGWPYVQHRGGPAGFLKVLGPRTLGFGDVRGNRQMLSAGNVSASDRVALFLMDYPQRSRLKLLGHARIVPASEDPALAARLRVDGVPAPERLVTIDVVAFDWNCPKYITPRYTKSEVDALVAPLHDRIRDLEARLRVMSSPPSPGAALHS